MKTDVQQVKQVWCDALGTDDVRTDALFYELGGNSVILLIILDEIHRRFEVEIPIADYDQYDTIEKMTAYINR